LAWQIARQQDSATGGINSSVAEASSSLSMPLSRASQVNLLLLLADRKLGHPPYRWDWGAGKACSFEQPRLRKKVEADSRATPQPRLVLRRKSLE